MFLLFGQHKCCELELQKKLYEIPLKLTSNFDPKCTRRVFLRKMPHLVVPARFFCACWEALTISSIIETKPTPTTPKPPSSPTIQNTHSHSKHTPHADTHRHLSQACTHINRRIVTDFAGGLSCVEHFVMTDGLAPKRQRFGNHDDLVSVLLLFVTKRSRINGRV